MSGRNSPKTKKKGFIDRQEKKPREAWTELDLAGEKNDVRTDYSSKEVSVFRRAGGPSRSNRLQSAKVSSRLPFQSSVIDFELQSIERLKMKQRREIEILLQNERMLEEMRQANLERDLDCQRKEVRQANEYERRKERLEDKKTTNE